MDWVTWDLSLALVLSKRKESVVVSMLTELFCGHFVLNMIELAR